MLFDYGQIVLSEIVNDELPITMAECKNMEYPDRHKCVMDKYKSGNDRITSKYDDIQLRMQQDFYWHPTKRVRSECRTLSNEERKEMWDAVNALKNDKSQEPNLYDWIADFHTNRAVYSVHYGPNFFGWHRCYILKFEELLRKMNPNVTLCYWDSRLDDHMKTPPLTVMFSPDFFGNPWGAVETGPFAGWKTIRGVPLKRDLGTKGSFISSDGIDKILSKESHFDISEPTAEEGFILENMHNNIHSCIGGQMDNFNTSSQEPAFWFHHSFIDSIWEKFCQKIRKNGTDPQDDYVTQWISSMQRPEKFMDRLTPLRNIDGYSHYFTKNIYEYEEWPSCENNCGNSEYLKCNREFNYCYSIEKFPRMQPKDTTRRYENHLSKPLSDSIILSGGKSAEQWVFIPIKIIFSKPINNTLVDSPIVGCEQEEKHERCIKAVVIVQSKGITYSGTYMDYINCDVSIPLWTYAFVAIKNPELGPSQSFVSVTDKEGKPCMPLCLAQDEMRYEMCTGVVNATTKEPKIYANTLEQAIQDGYQFDPISTDKTDKRVKLEFVCQ